MQTDYAEAPELIAKDGNVTLTTLQRAAAIVGRKLKLELVWAIRNRIFDNADGVCSLTNQDN